MSKIDKVPGVVNDEVAYSSEVVVNVKPNSFLVVDEFDDLGGKNGMVLMQKYEGTINGRKVKNYKLKIKYTVRHVFNTD